MHSQKYCAAPVVEEEWIKINEVVKKLLKIMKMCACVEMVLMTRYCMYTLMEQFTNVVIDCEVVEKQETG